MATGEDVLAFQETTTADKNDSQGTNSERRRKLTRNVSFADDEFLVEALEPEDPWKNARNITSVEVIAAYRRACHKTKAKPCEKLLKQLEACPSFEDRVDVLELRGFKLDTKGCEALEEVFRRVRTRTLDVENTNLEDDGFISLLEMIEFYQATCKLNAANNNRIKFRGWQVLSRTIRRTPCLDYLDIQGTVWTEPAIQFFGRALRLDCPLAVLHMENCNLSGRPLFLLASAVKFNHNLRDLFLGHNKLVSSDGQCLGAMLKGNSTLHLLDLRNNSLQDMGLGHVCEGLAEQEQGGLKTLVLWNNQLTHLSMEYLSKALVYTRSLETLNLGHNRLTNEAIHQLKDGLIRNRTLQRLGLLSTKLTTEGFVALSEVLADSKSLLRLDVRENEPYVGGLMALALSLKLNRTLLRIDLDKELKREPGMETTQRILLADIYSYCQRNKTLHEEEKSIERKAAEAAVHDGQAAPTSGQQLISGPPHLIQLETPPNEKEELKTLTSDYPPNSRFTVTKIAEDADEEPLVLVEDHFTGPDAAPVPYLQDPDSPSIAYFKDPDATQFQEFEDPDAGLGRSEVFQPPLVDLAPTDVTQYQVADVTSLHELEDPDVSLESKDSQSPLVDLGASDLTQSRRQGASSLKGFEDPDATLGESEDLQSPLVDLGAADVKPSPSGLDGADVTLENPRSQASGSVQSPDVEQLVNFMNEGSTTVDSVGSLSDQLSTVSLLDCGPAPDPFTFSNAALIGEAGAGLLLPEPAHSQPESTVQSSDDVEKELDAMLSAASNSKAAASNNYTPRTTDQGFWTREMDGLLNGTPASPNVDLLS